MDYRFSEVFKSCIASRLNEGEVECGILNLFRQNSTREDRSGREDWLFRAICDRLDAGDLQALSNSLELMKRLVES